MEKASPSSSSSPYIQLSVFMPLVIAIVGILSSTLAVILYHVIIMKYCQRAHGENDHAVRGNAGRHQSTDSLEMGLSREVLKSIPILFFSDRTKELFGMDLNECVICLGMLESGDIVRWLPNCRHVFHLPCIDNWLHGHANCPTCRTHVVVTPVMMNPLLNSPSLCGLQAHVCVGGCRGSQSDGSRSASVSGFGSVDFARDINELGVSDLQCPRLKRSFSWDYGSVVINIEFHGRGKTEPHPPFVPLASKRMPPRSFLGFRTEQSCSAHGMLQC
ncbi:hypothetical protein Drorol1_Dr00008826 [Drosera rotundifolia]